MSIKLIGASLALAAIIFGAGGCGAGSSLNEGSVVTEPAIYSQPQNASVPIGLSASWTVGASGVGLKYQWTKNGVPISGATGATYDTPPVVESDQNSSYAVTVSNPAGTVTSVAAILSVTARAPLQGDLRFQQVDAIDTLSGDTSDLFSYVYDGINWQFSGTVGSPISIGARVCYSVSFEPCLWGFALSYPPSGVAAPVTSYQSFPISQLSDQLSAWSTPQIVVNSLDLQRSSGEFAASWLQASGNGGFSLRTQSVPLSSLQNAAANEGLQSRVITAVSFDEGQVLYLSYGWNQDLSTLYETSVSIVTTQEEISSAAASLATRGYILTALGGDAANGFILIGTRVAGDTMPRLFTTDGIQCNNSLLPTSPTVVGLVAPDVATPEYTYLCER